MLSHSHRSARPWTLLVLWNRTASLTLASFPWASKDQLPNGEDILTICQLGKQRARGPREQF